MTTMRAAFGLFVLMSVLGACAEPPKTDEEIADDDLAAQIDTPKPIKLAPDAVNADRHFSDTVKVDADRLTVPTAGNEAMLAKLKAGMVIAGDRARSFAPTVAGPNDFGFLRRITAVKTDGTSTVLETQDATMEDWLAEGDIDLSSAQSIFDDAPVPAPSSIGTQSLHFLDDKPNEGAGGLNSPSATVSTKGPFEVTVSNATVRLNTTFDGYVKIRTLFHVIPKGVAYRVHINTNPLISAELEVAATREFAKKDKEWPGGEVSFGVTTPIPVTVSFTPILHCSVEAGGAISTTVNANIGASLDVGFEGVNTHPSFWHDGPNLHGGPTLISKPTGKATLTASCGVSFEVTVRLFGTAGFGGSVGPYASLNADVCKGGGFTLYEEHGVEGEIHGDIRVLHLVHRKFPIATLTVPLGDRQYLVGDDRTCEDKKKEPKGAKASAASVGSSGDDGAKVDVKDVDSCNGKKDGFYCSEVVDYGGFVCEGGQIAFGMQCLTEQKCIGGTKEGIDCK